MGQPAQIHDEQRVGALEIQEQIVRDTNDALAKFLQRAAVAMWNTDANANCSFTTTITVKKKTVGGDPKVSMEINSRERIPTPIIKRDLDFGDGKQLVLL